jgi:ABC-type polysaccharide/polyol phosphate export permease
MTDNRFLGLQSSIPEMYRQRDLMVLAFQRHIGNKHRRSILGVLWIMLTPLLMALLLFAVFGTLFAPSDIGSWPFLAYIYSGIIVFQFFSQTSMESPSCLKINSGMLTHTSAAPEVFLVSVVASNMLVLALSTTILILILIVTGSGSFSNIWLVLPTVLALAMLNLGVGSILARYAVRYEDVTALFTVAISALAYVTPTFYPISIIPAEWRSLYELNPLVPLLDMYRSSLGFQAQVGFESRVIAVVVSFSIGVVGLHWFRRGWFRVVTEL